MNRIEKVREVVDKLLLNITDDVERRCAYVHLYGVAQACALIASKRNENVELAVSAGMLHDIYSYVNMNSLDHEHKGAGIARDILNSLDEVLKDADVMQHILYNPLVEVKEHEKVRFLKICLIVSGESVGNTVLGGQLPHHRLV